MPAPQRKGTKRPARTGPARPSGRTTGRPTRISGRPSARGASSRGASARGASSRGASAARRGGPKPRPLGDRPRLHGPKPVLVKRSERPAGTEKSSVEKPPRPRLAPKRLSAKPAGPKFAGRKIIPVRRTAKSRVPSLVKKHIPKREAGVIPAASTPPGTVRLNKYISNAGITSRRKADELITQGKVIVNGKLVTELGVQVKPFEDVVSVNGEVVSPKPRHIYLLLNKPKDTITTTSDEKDRATVLDYVKTSDRVYPVGRLDRNTTGVLLLTNDGELTNRLTHPSFEIEREYHVTLDKRLETSDAKKIAEGGIDLGEGDVTGSAELITGDAPNDVFLKLREGKNREVRRLFEALGYEVEKLDRVSFAGLTHRGMGRGESRALTNSEVHQLRELAGLEL